MYEASIIKADSFFAIAQKDKCFITMQFKKLALQGAFIHAIVALISV